jgi:asparagine synthase (glutamine-hydrolysing)
VGTYLSGGLDSSIVTCLASRHYDNALKAFTGTFSEGPKYDESRYAKKVADFCKCELYEVTPSPNDFVDSIGQLIYHMDEPAAGPGAFAQYMVSKMAAHRVKVVLGGQGGDEIFGGYARYLIGYLEQCLKGAIFETQEEGKHIVTLSSIIPNLPLLGNYRPLMQSFLSEGLFEDMDLRYFRLVDRGQEIIQKLSPGFFTENDRDRIFQEFRAVFNHPDTKSYFNKMTHFDQMTLLPALLHVEDRVSMAVSIESRVPLLDKRIVRTVQSMPPPMKFKGGRSKHILRHAARNFVPEEILSRKDKMGFPVPINCWLGGPLKDFVSDTLLSRSSLERSIFTRPGIEDLLSNPQPYSRALWGVLCLELWFRTFIDG